MDFFKVTKPKLGHCWILGHRVWGGQGLRKGETSAGYYAKEPTLIFRYVANNAVTPVVLSLLLFAVSIKLSLFFLV